MLPTTKTRSLTLALAATAFSAGAQTRVAEELVPAGEARLTETIAAIISQQVLAQHGADGHATRDAHAKHHGCVRADFTVNASLPADLARGVFRPGASYKSWIRYSNGSGRSQDDQEGDGRGMAIKLVDAGDNLMGGTSQDFLLINHPVFFVRNAADYVEFSQALAASGNPLGFFFPGVNPLNWRVSELRIARAIQGKKIASPLSTPYFSMTPYLHGDGTAVKYQARPCRAEAAPTRLPSSPDYLREAMEARLTSGGACFELLVQKQVDPRAMPIEDPTVEWSEARSPYRKVATITIPAQQFASPAQMAFCENLSFTPWNALPEHRPLGGINRVRKTVYETISALRHELNGAPREEPTGEELFD